MTFVAALLAISTGCASAPPVAPVVTAAAPRPPSLRERAIVELGCERAQIVELGPHHVAATGCGAQREYRHICSGRGCEWVAIDDLAIRASFELECPVAELEIITLGGSSRGPIGCGARATYVLVCQSEGCHWLPSSVRRASPGTQLAPASLFE